MARVESARFLRFSCDHELFQDTYTRSNRTKGTKILRCFPHCCPEHKPRCYCGCSLHVLVSFADLAAVRVDELIVCARFEAARNDDDEGGSGAASVHFGATVTVPTAQLARDAEDDGNAAWILADRESDVMQREVPKNNVLFVMNHHRFPRWYYSYESGATKSQREMQHHLVVYVTTPPVAERDRRFVQRGMQRLSVLSRLASPAFTLVSYRRARGDIKTPTAPESDDPLVRLAGARATVRTLEPEQNSNGKRHRDEPESALSVPQRSVRAHVRAPRAAGGLGPILSTASSSADAVGLVDENDSAEHEGKRESESESSADASDSAHSNCHVHSPPLETPASASTMNTHSDVLAWQQRAASVRKLRLLHVVHVVLSEIGLGDLAFGLGEISDQLREQWLFASHSMATASTQSNRGLETWTRLAAALRLSAFAEARTRPCVAMRLTSLPVVAQCVDVLLHLLSSEPARRVWQRARQISLREAMDRRRLRRLFLDVVDALHADVEASMRQPGDDDASSSLAGLVDELLSLACRESRLQTLPLAMTRVLSGAAHSETIFFEAFVNQMRAASVSANARRPTLSAAAVPRGIGRTTQSKASAWSRRWLLDASSFRVRRPPDVGAAHTGSDSASAPLNSVIGWLTALRRWMALELTMNDDSLDVRSLLAPTSAATGGGMRLVLDDRRRIFQSFPDGWAVPCSGLASTDGDYVGRVSGDRREITCDFFSFSGAPRDVALSRVSVTATLRVEQTAMHPHGASCLVQAVMASARWQPSPSLTPRLDSLAMLPVATRHWIYGASAWRTTASAQAVFHDVS